MSSASPSPAPPPYMPSSSSSVTAASSPAPGTEENEEKEDEEEARGVDVGDVDMSPPRAEDLDAPNDTSADIDPAAEDEAEGELTASQLSRLEHVLERSALYSSILKQQMDDARRAHAEKRAEAAAAASKSKSKSTSTLASAKAKGKAKAKSAPQTGKGRGRPAKKRRVVADSDSDASEGEEEGVEDAKPAGEATDTDIDTAAFPQPALVTGGKLKDYQLEGLQWMVGLHQQGISGILADEMGLGKTLQTIAFAAHLRATGTRPFLAVCPLSVMHNWVAEFARWAPAIPVLMYHGTPAERAEMRRTTLALPEDWPPPKDPTPTPAPAPVKGKGRGSARRRGRGQGAASAASTSAPPVPAPPASPARRSARNAAPTAVAAASASTARGRGRGRGARGGGVAAWVGAGTKRKRLAESEDELEDEDADAASDAEDSDAGKLLSLLSTQRRGSTPADTSKAEKPLTKAQRARKALEKKHDDHFAAFPVVITTYDLIIKDRTLIGGIPWSYIVVDEGHRLKNMNCALVREIKRYSSAGRMVLTGTPLHNNLAELWSLLNFILPDIFSDVEAFQEWFSLPRMSALLPSARMGRFVGTLHAILQPFLLRRMKVDVLGPLLPPKKSYVLYARLSARQREAYEAVLSGGVRAWVAGGAGAASSASTSTPKASTSPVAKAADAGMTLRARRRRGEGKGKGAKRDAEEEEEERRRAAEAFARKGAAKHVNNMKLQNTVMQLRKVCSHPFLFSRPDDDSWSLGRAPPTPTLLAAREAELLGASGKMLLLDRLLGELFRRGHKVLLFSQFTTMLDIIEDWAVDMKGWNVCRIDGTTPPLERRDQMDVFQSAGDAPDAPRLFLLSTRSGGLGVNLTAADTVIFYDQDWNPQMDAQAQDRAHRIGQTKPVLIFRLVSAHTIEEKIMQRAAEKRKLEALVIAKGKFKMPAADVATGKRATMAEMAADLLRLEGEQIDVLPPTTQAGDEGILSDADLEALLDRSAEVFADRGTGWRSSAKGNGQAAFAVFEPPPDAGTDALAGMMGEEAEE
ncbi:SNF2 family N-terminal domain-containing protein [Mycena olivaceomarginata]|nr:SNF2 family N-terminal domain-containing protein [Mycena olivaceomarginata]